MDGFSEFIKPDLAETHDVGKAGKHLEEFLQCSRDLVGLAPYGRYLNQNQWGSRPAFRTPRINYMLARAVEEILPRKVVRAIENVREETSPLILHIKGLPAGMAGDHEPEAGFPLSAMMLRGVSALVLKGNDDWNNAIFASNFRFESNSETNEQLMHSDFAEDTDIPAYQLDRPVTPQVFSFLHYTKTNGLTPTWFTPYNSDDAKKPPDVLKHIPVVANSGDLLIFKNKRLLHARGESPKVGPDGAPASPARHFIGINIEHRFYDCMPKQAATGIPSLPPRKADFVEAHMQ